jgi:hypothetical protein
MNWNALIGLRQSSDPFSVGTHSRVAQPTNTGVSDGRGPSTGDKWRNARYAGTVGIRGVRSTLHASGKYDEDGGTEGADS